MKKSVQKYVMLAVAVSLFVVVSPFMAIAADLPVVVMIATGGTIAMKIDPVKKAPVPAISGEDLLSIQIFSNKARS